MMKIWKQVYQRTLLPIMIILVISSGSFSGELEPPAGPDDPGSAMHTLEDVYNRLETGAAGEKRTGELTDPTEPPASTGRTIDEVMQKMPAIDDSNGLKPEDVECGKSFWSFRSDSWGPQTGTLGLSIWYPDFDGDGYGDPSGPFDACEQPADYILDNTDCDDSTDTIRPGIIEIYGNEIDENCDGHTYIVRFTDMGDGTVRDETTGLIWLKNANAFSDTYSSDAEDIVAELNSGEYGLNDGSTEGDWRLPHIGEWKNLRSKRTYDNPPALDDTSGNGQWTPGTRLSAYNQRYTGQLHYQARMLIVLI